MISDPLFPPDCKSIRPRSFLGFPSGTPIESIPVDGDVVVLNGANGCGKSSLLEALALSISGGHGRRAIQSLVHQGSTGYDLLFDGELHLQSDNEGLLQNSAPSWWHGNEKARQAHFHRVFFHPNLLTRLFEEEWPDLGDSIADLLAPAPSEVGALQAALKTAHGSLSSRRSEWAKAYGLPDEAAIKERRRDQAARFNETLTRWRNHDPQVMEWLKEMPEVSITIKGSNLRKGWEGELANIFDKIVVALRNDANAGLGDAIDSLKQEINPDSTPAESLSALAAAARLTIPKPSALAEPPIKYGPELAARFAQLPPDVWHRLQSIERSEARDLYAFSNDPMASQFAEKRGSERLAEIRKVRAALGRGPLELPQLIAQLQRDSRNWTEYLHRERLPGNPPQALLEWFHQLSAHTHNWAGVEPLWLQWNVQLDEEEKKLSYELDTIQRSREANHQLTKIHEELKYLFELHPDLQGTFHASDSGSEFAANLRDCQRGSSEARQAPSVEPAEAFARVCVSWAESEKLQAIAEARASEPRNAAVQQGFRALDDLLAKVKKETGTTGVLGQLQFDTLQKSLVPLENFLNETLKRFRVFDGIAPIGIGPDPSKRGRQRLRLSIGNIQSPRSIDQVSTGQRSQVGLLLFLALHYGLRETYKSPFICLDEITSHFDLGQVPRLALLIRQIAYSKNAAFRRRVFIASHNVQFTQRLIQQLTPPEGRKLRVLNFTGYDVHLGPKITPYMVDAMPAFDIARAKRYFIGRYGQRDFAS
jgi:energy-coupling factor transporter ATP-binding protein EcfA2